MKVIYITIKDVNDKPPSLSSLSPFLDMCSAPLFCDKPPSIDNNFNFTFIILQ